jgi:hypothetical protein
MGHVSMVAEATAQRSGRAAHAERRSGFIESGRRAEDDHEPIRSRSALTSRTLDPAAVPSLVMSRDESLGEATEGLSFAAFVASGLE